MAIEVTSWCSSKSWFARCWNQRVRGGGSSGGGGDGGGGGDATAAADGPPETRVGWGHPLTPALAGGEGRQRLYAAAIRPVDAFARTLHPKRTHARGETRCFIVTASPSVVVVVAVESGRVESSRVESDDRQIATERGKEATEVFHLRERLPVRSGYALVQKKKKERERERKTGRREEDFGVSSQRVIVIPVLILVDLTAVKSFQAI